MKKTVKINIDGIIFHVDEDAFVILNDYLNNLKKHFKTDKAGKEIIADIESRIAELMQLKLSTDKQVINLEDINEITEIMGNPEEFIDNQEGEGPTSSTQEKESQNTSRRYYRDLDNNILGGVCAGLGIHFNIDPLVVRILFIVLAFPLFGFTVLLYLILWIVLPPALTTQQKMEMRGGTFKVSDIEHSVKTEYENVKENFSQYKDSEGYRKTQRVARNAGNGLVEILNFLGRFITIVLGIALIAIGIAFIVGFFGLFVFSDTFLFWTNFDHHHTFVPDFMFSFMTPQSIILASICVIILIAAPTFAMIYWGLKLILRFKANDKTISLIGFFAWLISLIILIGIFMVEAKEFAFYTNLDESKTLQLEENTTLYVKPLKNMDNYSEVYFFDEGLEVYSHPENPKEVFFAPELRIKHTDNNNIRIKVEREARGATNQLAQVNTKSINFNYQIIDSVLYIDPLFNQETNQRWNFPEIKVTIYLPEGQQIFVDEKLDDVMHWSETAEGVSSWEIPGEVYIMTEEGLDYKGPWY